MDKIFKKTKTYEIIEKNIFAFVVFLSVSTQSKYFTGCKPVENLFCYENVVSEFVDSFYIIGPIKWASVIDYFVFLP